MTLITHSASKSGSMQSRCEKFAPYGASEKKTSQEINGNLSAYKRACRVSYIQVAAVNEVCTFPLCVSPTEQINLGAIRNRIGEAFTNIRNLTFLKLADKSCRSGSEAEP